MKELVDIAVEASNNAYAPYSKFNVGAAVKLKNGQVITGANIENASFGLTNCAERTALFYAYAQGYRKEDIVAFAIVTDTETPGSPCGACRQVMSELLPKECEIYLGNFKGNIKQTTMAELLPYAFSSEDL